MNKLLIRSILLPNVVGLVASLFTRNAMGVFETMEQPPLSPPSILFPIVWTVLYTLMGISSYLVLTSNAPQEQIQKANTVYLLQLLVNFIWPTLFFNLEWYLFSFFWLLLLWGLVLIMIIQFYQISKVAAYLNIPYLIWLTFAGYLNFGVYWLNR